VVFFHLLTGEMPYQGRNLLMQVNIVCNPRRHPRWELLTEYRWSLGARLLCQRLLAKDDDIRPSAGEALKDDWLVRMRQSAPEVTATPGERRALLQASMQSHLMHMARHCITSQLPLSPLHHLNGRFQQCDITGDGRLSHLEMRQVLEDMGITHGGDIDLIIESLDSNRNGFIEYSEFISGCLDLGREDMRKQLRSVFDIFDLDGSGTISISELEQILTKGANPEGMAWGTDMTLGGANTVLPDGKTVEEVMRELDVDNSGFVDYNEFERFLLFEHEETSKRLTSCSGES